MEGQGEELPIESMRPNQEPVSELLETDMIPERSPAQDPVEESMPISAPESISVSETGPNGESEPLPFESGPISEPESTQESSPDSELSGGLQGNAGAEQSICATWLTEDGQLAYGCQPKFALTRNGNGKVNVSQF